MSRFHYPARVHIFHNPHIYLSQDIATFTEASMPPKYFDTETPPLISNPTQTKICKASCHQEVYPRITSAPYTKASQPAPTTAAMPNQPLLTPVCPAAFFGAAVLLACNDVVELGGASVVLAATPALPLGVTTTPVLIGVTVIVDSVVAAIRAVEAADCAEEIAAAAEEDAPAKAVEAAEDAPAMAVEAADCADAMMLLADSEAPASAVDACETGTGMMGKIVTEPDSVAVVRITFGVTTPEVIDAATELADAAMPDSADAAAVEMEEMAEAATEEADATAEEIEAATEAAEAEEARTDAAGGV